MRTWPMNDCLQAMFFRTDMGRSGSGVITEGPTLKVLVKKKKEGATGVTDLLAFSYTRDGWG